MADQLFDGLTTHDPQTAVPVPALAATWASSADQRVWEFTLRPGLTFGNGRSITAADVKYSVERVARRTAGSAGSDLLTSVNGYQAFALQQSVPELAGVTAKSEAIVRFLLDQPQSDLPSILGSPVFGVVPRESVDTAQPPFAQQPVGSGPFSLQERAADRLLLVPARGRRAAVDAVEVVQLPDETTAYQAFEDGRVDVAPVPPGEVEDAGRRFGRDAFRPYAAELFYAFNLRSPVLAEPLLREAIIRAVDRAAIVAAVYGSSVRPLEGVVVAGVTGHQDDPCGERCRYDPVLARSIIAGAYGTNPPEVRVAFDDDAAQRAVANAIKLSLDGIGIRATLDPKPIKEYRDFAASGRQELFRLGWIARYPSADDFLPPLFQTGSTNNLTGFSDPLVDALLTEARSTADPVGRAALFNRAERAVMDRVPVLPIAQFQLHLVVAPRVRGLALTSMGTFDASKVSLVATP
jgi:ABC-type oligopeptide transport system substrate-binding subunit